MIEKLFLLSLMATVAGCVSSIQPDNLADMRQQVFDTEQAFADTMARRDFEGFKTFLADEAIFFSGETGLRGAEKVAQAWKGLYQKPEAAFSWQPKTVEVLDSGSIALSSGPVFDSKGNIIGVFNSIWRRESSGQWRIIFDKGGDVCPSP